MYIIILSIRMGSFLNGLLNIGIKGRWSVTIVKLPPIRNTLNLSQAHLAAKASPSVCEYLDSARVVEPLIYIIGRHFPLSSCSIVAPRPVLWKSTCISVGLPISKNQVHCPLTSNLSISQMHFAVLFPKWISQSALSTLLKVLLFLKSLQWTFLMHLPWTTLIEHLLLIWVLSWFSVHLLYWDLVWFHLLTQ